MFLYFTINTESVFTEVFLSVCSIRLSPICVVSGVCLLHVSDSAVDGHLFQTPCQPSAALLWLGARYYCHVHQQVRYTHTHTWPRIRTHTEKACGPTFAPPTQYMSLFQYWRTHPGQNCVWSQPGWDCGLHACYQWWDLLFYTKIFCRACTVCLPFEICE